MSQKFFEGGICSSGRTGFYGIWKNLSKILHLLEDDIKFIKLFEMSLDM